MQKLTSLQDRAQTSPTNQLSASAMLSALWRTKTLIILCVAIGILMGGFYAFFVATPRYTAMTTLALQLRNEQIVNLEQVLSGVSTDTAALNTELEIIQSRSVLEKLVKELDLASSPDFNATLREEKSLSFSGLRNAVSAKLTALASTKLEKGGEPIEVLTHEQKSLNLAVKSVGNAITVVNRHNTYVFEIRATTGNAFLSGRLANTLAKIYIQDQIDVKFQATENAVSWLSRRVAELRGDLESKEFSFKELRAKMDLRNPDFLDAISLQIRENVNRLKSLSEDIIRLEAQISRIEAIRHDQSLVQIAKALQDPTLDLLLSQTEVDERRERFMARVELLTQSAATSLDRAKRQSITLENSVKRLRSEMGVQSEQLISLQQMERDLDSTRTLYETFLTRLKETTVQRGLQQADSRILSEATPGRYVAPRKMFILILSALLGGLVGIAWALKLNFLVSGFRSAADLEAVSGLPVFGEVPRMPIRGRDKLIDYLNDSPTSPAVEAVRNLRTSLTLSDAAHSPQVILITSSVPGEGKTTIAISLAHNMVGLGRRTILVEADMRRRSLEEYFKLPTNQTAGASALDDTVPLRDVIVRDSRVGFDVLLGEDLDLSAADLFASDKFCTLLRRLREEYDYIIIDSPPVLVVPDARLVGPLVDSILYAVAWQRTDQSQVAEGLHQFSSINLPVSGLILSQVDTRKMHSYGYGGRYGRYSSYGKGYYNT